MLFFLKFIHAAEIIGLDKIELLVLAAVKIQLIY